MNKKFYFTITPLVIAAGVGLAAADAVGASHEVTMQFEVTRDVGIAAWSEGGATDLSQIEQMSSAGLDERPTRAFKSTQHAIVMDFDTAAMGTFLQDNPGLATWTFNVRSADFPDQELHNNDISILTVESTNDWAEGDSERSLDNFTWTSGTAAATYFYAQTVYNDVGGVLELDTVNSLQWIDPDSGSYTFTPRGAAYVAAGVPDDVGIGNGGTPGVPADPTPAFTNSEVLTFDIIDQALFDDAYASIGLDNDIANALINDENNRGLRFGPLTGAENQNWSIWTAECDSVGLGKCAVFLEVTIVPEDSADFDDDGDVDGSDYIVKWQRGDLPDGVNADDLARWENQFGTLVSAPSTASVPEPSSLLLLLACSSAMLCGRYSNRKAA